MCKQEEDVTFWCLTWTEWLDLVMDAGNINSRCKCNQVKSYLDTFCQHCSSYSCRLSIYICFMLEGYWAPGRSEPAGPSPHGGGLSGTPPESWPVCRSGPTADKRTACWRGKQLQLRRSGGLWQNPPEKQTNTHTKYLISTHRQSRNMLSEGWYIREVE